MGRKIKIGLVLGGGGARGLAHIGILKVLQDHGIPVDVIVGTSMGAIVGASFAQTPDANHLKKQFTEFIKSDKFRSLDDNFFRQQPGYEPEDILHQLSREIKRRLIINLAAHRVSLMKAERLEIALDALVKDELIENTKIPFACAALDLRSAKDIVFKSGKIRKAIQASSAIPGFLPPVEYNGYLLVDGSVSANFPINAARELGADIIIALDVSLSTYAENGFDNVIDIIIRSNMAATRKINELTLGEADLVISPRIGNITWSAFEQIDHLIAQGIVETEKRLPEINELILRKKGLWAKSKTRFSHILK
ncbi:MAG: patatin-like phospholipase family protein [Calditrichaceae bacterium]